MTIYFDMDGTIADFYGVENWLQYLNNEDTTPYTLAKPLINFSLLARYIHKAQAKGIKFGIISWGSKTGSDEFLERIINAKKEWLHNHLKSVIFDEMFIVPYGTPKSNFKPQTDAILFDDEERNRIDWGKGAYEVEYIMEILKEISK